LKKVNVIQIGLLVFVLGGLGYELFLLLGFESVSSGIASEAILIVLVFAWTISYLLRVFTGKMTFVEQREKYRKAYEKFTEEKLQAKLNSMTEAEKNALIAEIEKDENKSSKQ
tara:strand:- start:130 stop:468 length:339 start_codon:yes stop_codon:yes gene_type:complete